LSEEEEARFDELLDQDEGCRDLYHEFILRLPEESESPGSPSLSFIRDRIEVGRDRNDLTTQLLRQYVERSAENRDRMLAAGFDPSDLARPSPPERVELDRRTRGLDRVRRWVSDRFYPQGLTLAWATGATIVAVFFYVERTPEVDIVGGGTVGLVVRGSATTIAAGPDGLCLRVEPPTDIPPDTKVELSVTDPRGERFGKRKGLIRDLCAPSLLVFRTKERPEAGTYRLTFRKPDGGVSSFEFVVRATP
jgi:hypothetical protein